MLSAGFTSRQHGIHIKPRREISSVFPKMWSSFYEEKTMLQKNQIKWEVNAIEQSQIQRFNVPQSICHSCNLLSILLRSNYQEQFIIHQRLTITKCYLCIGGNYGKRYSIKSLALQGLTIMKGKTMVNDIQSDNNSKTHEIVIYSWWLPSGIWFSRQMSGYHMFTAWLDICWKYRLIAFLNSCRNTCPISELLIKRLNSSNSVVFVEIP